MPLVLNNYDHHVVPNLRQEEYNLLRNTPIEGLFSINDNGKKNFSQQIRKITNPKVFKNLTLLFSEIDFISKITIEYID